MMKLKHKEKLGLYGLAAGVITAGSAQAAPTPSPNILTLSVQDGFSVSAPFDINNDGVDDFEIDVFASATCDSGQQGTVRLSGQGDPDFSARFARIDEDQYYAANISSGEAIPGTFAFNDFVHLLGCNDFSNQENAQFQDLGTGFVGLSFEAAGNTHFGFLEVELIEGSLTLNVLSACYEDQPGVPLQAGQCFVPSIPVNGVVIPLTLSLMALGGLALRRRQRVAA